MCLYYLIPLNLLPQWGNSGAVIDKEQVQGHCMMKGQSLNLTPGLNTESRFFPLYPWSSCFSSHENSLKGLLSHKTLSITLRVSDSVYD